MKILEYSFSFPALPPLPPPFFFLLWSIGKLLEFFYLSFLIMTLTQLLNSTEETWDFQFQMIIIPGGANGKEPTGQCRRWNRCGWSLGWEDPLEKEIATHSSILAWEMSWTGEPWATVRGAAKSRTRLSDWASLSLESLHPICLFYFKNLYKGLLL